MAEKPEDLSLPASVVTRLIKDALPEGVNVSKEARTAIGKAASIFILYSTACANNFALKGKRKTLNTADIFSALEDMEFDEFIPELKECLEAYKLEQKGKREAAADRRKKQTAATAAASASQQIQQLSQEASQTSSSSISPSASLPSSLPTSSAANVPFKGTSAIVTSLPAFLPQAQVPRPFDPTAVAAAAPVGGMVGVAEGAVAVAGEQHSDGREMMEVGGASGELPAPSMSSGGTSDGVS